MTKEVLIHIKTEQFLADEAENNQDVMELITSGEYYFRNGTHYLLYDEVMEGFTETTQNLVKVRPNFMEVRKKGTVNVTMVFEKNKKNVTFYKTPFGALHMEIEASNISFKDIGACIEICAEYTLGMNERPVGDCKMQMRVTVKGDAESTTFFKNK